ncbi:hypothetical protein [Candidatus Nitrosotalea bavarica]|uniref:hypothetical protein n=1 Tax=Candidatus Nitrosotalea bavarica TaxID=1903277 RepID=UPI000C714112|nr:hypothetical protein [Candidatus Nitrosotalea bavarica]
MLEAVDILRQRIFIDHSYKAKTFIKEEFTFRTLFDVVTNVFIVQDHFMPNLHIYDSDGEELPLVSNEHTFALLTGRMRTAVGTERQAKEDFLQELRDKKKFILWIRIPTKKALTKNEFRIITLEYDAPKEKQKSNQITTEYKRNALHSVFYIIRKPEDYEFTRKPRIAWTDNKDDYKIFTDWEIKKDGTTPMYVNETSDTLSITIRPDVVKSMDISYSFRANKHVVFFPVLAATVLAIATIPLYFSHQCDWFNACGSTVPPTIQQLIDHRFDFAIGIIAASFVTAGLIRNEAIRHSHNILFIIPLALALISLI